MTVSCFKSSNIYHMNDLTFVWVRLSNINRPDIQETESFNFFLRNCTPLFLQRVWCPFIWIFASLLYFKIRLCDRCYLQTISIFKSLHNVLVAILLFHNFSVNFLFISARWNNNIFPFHFSLHLCIMLIFFFKWILSSYFSCHSGIV